MLPSGPKQALVYCGGLGAQPPIKNPALSGSYQRYAAVNKSEHGTMLAQHCGFFRRRTAELSGSRSSFVIVINKRHYGSIFRTA